MDRLAGVILRPGLHLPAVATASLVREEAQVAVPGRRELAMGLEGGRKPNRIQIYSPPRLMKDLKQDSLKSAGSFPGTSAGVGADPGFPGGFPAGGLFQEDPSARRHMAMM